MEILCGFCHIIQLDIFKHRKVRCKKKHILPPIGGNFTRLRFAAPWQASEMERQRNGTPSQAERNGASSQASRNGFL